MDSADLGLRLKNIGSTAERDLPPVESYTSCCGIFLNTHAKTYQARVITLKLIHWLRFLGERKDDMSDAVLKGALILAEKFLAIHRDALNEIELFEEIEAIKCDFMIEDLPKYFDALQTYSQRLGHHKYPDIIKDYLRSHPNHESKVEYVHKSRHHFWQHFSCFGGGQKDDDYEQSTPASTLEMGG